MCAISSIITFYFWFYACIYVALDKIDYVCFQYCIVPVPTRDNAWCQYLVCSHLYLWKLVYIIHMLSWFWSGNGWLVASKISWLLYYVHFGFCLISTGLLLNWIRILPKHQPIPFISSSHILHYCHFNQKTFPITLNWLTLVQSNPISF